MFSNFSLVVVFFLVSYNTLRCYKEGLKKGYTYNKHFFYIQVYFFEVQKHKIL